MARRSSHVALRMNQFSRGRTRGGSSSPRLHVSSRAPGDIEPRAVSGPGARSKRSALGAVENFFPLAKKYNVKLTFGTDLAIGTDTSLQTKELVMRSKWLTPYELLVQPTSRGGELVALAGPRNPYQGKLGVIEEGAYADMLLVDGNPLDNIDLIGHPDASFVLIIKNGTIYKNAVS